MSEINKIDLIKVNARLKANQKQEQTKTQKNGFEDQLLETVKKLETMGNEVNEMMKSNTLQVTPVGKRPVNPSKELLSNIDSIVENFSAAGKSSIKSAQTVASEYGSMKNSKGS